ncbi:hypothetical protein FPQ18DRAFT_314132 [Pyronema domesticum]|nr:hypothetical protein FPQ18DRAFT_314132 [Pyronema domesticum]
MIQCKSLNDNFSVGDLVAVAVVQVGGSLSLLGLLAGLLLAHRKNSLANFNLLLPYLSTLQGTDRLFDLLLLLGLACSFVGGSLDLLSASLEAICRDRLRGAVLEKHGESRRGSSESSGICSGHCIGVCIRWVLDGSADSKELSRGR